MYRVKKGQNIRGKTYGKYIKDKILSETEDEIQNFSNTMLHTITPSFSINNEHKI